MKINRLILSACTLFIGTSFLYAQSYETSAKWNKKSEPSVSVAVNAPQEIAIESLFSLLKSEKLKGKKSGKTLRFEKVIFPTISNDYINIYATVDANDNNNSTVNIFVNRGDNNDFISGSTDGRLVDNLKNYLNSKYQPAASKANYNYKIDTQKNLIKGSEKGLKKMQGDLEKKIKQKEKLEKEIEALTKQIGEQGELLDQQSGDLKKITQ